MVAQLYVDKKSLNCTFKISEFCKLYLSNGEVELLFMDTQIFIVSSSLGEYMAL